MTRKILIDDDAAQYSSIEDRLRRLEQSVSDSKPQARMTWSGSVAMSTNAHYGFDNATGLGGLGITGTAQFDTGGMLILGSGQIVAPIRGLYLGIVQGSWAANATAGPRSSLIRRNSPTGTLGTLGGVAAAVGSTVGASNSSGSLAAGIWPLEEGAQMEATFYQNIGANLNITAIVFSMVYLAPTEVGL